MRIAALLAGGLVAVLAQVAQAHAHLKQSSPADGSSLAGAPTELVLDFTESARLTALDIRKDAEEPHKLVPPDLSQAHLVVKLPPLTPGVYVVRWRALSADGHIVPGQLRFTLRP